MHTRTFLIAGGNSTALVWDCPTGQRRAVSLRLLERVEQVGFIEPGAAPVMTMMGSELCINGTIAFAATLGGQGQLRTSGLDTPVTYENTPARTTIGMQIDYRREGSIVLLSGIGFEIVTGGRAVDKAYAAALAERYQLPAFGIGLLRGSRLSPYVYVKETDTLVEETACGSGSICVSVITGMREVVQPTGETITVVQDKNGIFVSAKVKEISPPDHSTL